MDHLRKKWALKSLIIGPQSNKTNPVFWNEALKDLPLLPQVDNVTVIHHYHTDMSSMTDRWRYFDRVLARRDLFPALKKVYAKSDCESQGWWSILNAMPAVVARGLGPVSFLPLGETVGLIPLMKRRLVFEKRLQTLSIRRNRKCD